MWHDHDEEPDEHDRGLSHDLPTLLSRRRALGLLGGPGWPWCWPGALSPATTTATPAARPAPAPRRAQRRTEARSPRRRPGPTRAMAPTGSTSSPRAGSSAATSPGDS